MTQGATWAVVVGYGVIGLAGLAIMYAPRPAAWKRRVLPWYTAVTAAAFLGVVWATAGGVPWFVVALVAVVAVLNVRAAKFCERCGRPVRRSLIGARGSCPGCGAPIP